MSKGILLIARVLLTHMLVFSGITKIVSYGASAKPMASGGVPGELLPRRDPARGSRCRDADHRLQHNMGCLGGWPHCCTTWTLAARRN